MESIPLQKGMLFLFIRLTKKEKYDIMLDNELIGCILVGTWTINGEDHELYVNVGEMELIEEIYGKGKQRIKSVVTPDFHECYPQHISKALDEILSR